MKRPIYALVLAALIVACVFAQDAPQPEKAEPTDSVFDSYDKHGVVKPFHQLNYKRLDEPSGLQYWQGAWWSHNDSGDGPVLYRASDPTFTGAQPFAVPGAKAVDWEEITVIGDDLLVCDIGDNRRERDDITLYRVAWDASAAKLKTVATYPVSYPDGRHNAEAAAVIDGKLYIFGKRSPQETYTGVYRFDELKDGKENVPVLSGKLDLDERVALTAAAYDAETKKLVLLSYTRIFVYGEKLEGKPERSVLIYAQQCESLCLHDGALLYGNEQGQIYRVNKFLSSQYEFLLPPWNQLELPVQDEAAEPDGTGQAWKQGSAELPLKGLGEGEYVRWKVCGGYLMLAGAIRYESFTSSNEHGPRRGSALILMLGSEWTDFLTGEEKHLWLGDNGATGIDAWSLSMEDFSLAPLKGIKASGGMKDKVWTFEYAIPLTTIFGEGELPATLLVNAWGFGLHGEDEPHLTGESLACMSNPYTWAGVELKLPAQKDPPDKEK
ncbi:MAG: hypothetical protein KDB90_02795 [Planctomycetes bacterium]|nr:hypothetical protein [Planctomycetota bacterium]